MLSRPASTWIERQYLPNYGFGEAAGYAQTTADRVRRWHGNIHAPIELAKPRQEARLSYPHLIELVIVRNLRDAGVSLQVIRKARDFVATKFGSEFPFANFKFKSDGKQLLMEYQEAAKIQLIEVNMGGQLALQDVLDKCLIDFDYEVDSTVKWWPRGRGGSVVIDPRFCFGKPNVRAVPTWAIAGQWEAGNPLDDIADDFDLTEKDVRDALEFEGAIPSGHGSH